MTYEKTYVYNVFSSSTLPLEDIVFYVSETPVRSDLGF